MKSENLSIAATSSDYGQNWLVSNGRTFKDLGDNDLKIRFLEKSLKSKRRIEQRNANTLDVDEELNEKYKYDKNAVIGRKFPFEAKEYRYPNDNKNKPKSLYLKSSEVYGAKKPNDLEMPEKYFPINNTFTKEFNKYMYEDNSLNTAMSRSKVHPSLDSVI